MQNYQENLAARINGALQPLLGVSVLVTASNGLPAALYKDDGATPLGNPLTTDADGYFGFFAPNGRYTLTFSGAQIQTSSRSIELYDADDVSPVTQQQLASASGAGMIGYGTQTVAQALDGKAPSVSPTFTGAPSVVATGTASATVKYTAPSGKTFEVGSAGTGFGTAPAFFVYDVTAARTRVLIDGNGNLGIGTAAPAQKLHVYGGAAVYGSATLGATSGGGLMSLEGPVFRTYVGDGTGWSWRLSKRAASATTDLVTLRDNGMVGIGNDAPDSTLTVNNVVSGRTVLSVVGGAGSLFVDYNGSGSNYYEGTQHIFTTQNAAAERARIDASGNLLVGATGGNYHKIYKSLPADAGNLLIDIGDGSHAGFGIYATSGPLGNAANATAKVARDGTTSRSLNAAGTINASGADYAEYMTKAADCGVIGKGQIVGVNTAGLLTDKWADAVAFLIKSTDPSYVGGDVWGSEEALGIERPSEPVLELPAYTGSEKPANLAEGEASWEERDAALAQYEADQAAHAEAVSAAQQQFDDVTMPAYRAALADFEAKLEAARQKVDRIAYCGQVPVNVTGAQPGQYVVPVQDGDGIGGKLVNKSAMTLAQYMAAVGIVQNVLPDGRANVRVKVV